MWRMLNNAGAINEIATYYYNSVHVMCMCKTDVCSHVSYALMYIIMHVMTLGGGAVTYF